jgi:hypothetical protein
LSIRKNERKGGSDEPDAPLLLERELAVGEGDVVIGGEKSNQANNAANNGFQNCLAVKPQSPPRQRRIQIPRASIHPKQLAPITTATSLVHAYASAHVLKSVRLLAESDAQVFNLDKYGYASDLTSIEALPQAEARHQLLKVDLTDAAATAAAVQQADPDLVLHLAAESHVDRSIEGPGAFIESNMSGTFQLLQAVRAHWEGLSAERKAGFRFHHIQHR